MPKAEELGGFVSESIQFHSSLFISFYLFSFITKVSNSRLPSPLHAGR